MDAVLRAFGAELGAALEKTSWRRAATGAHVLPASIGSAVVARDLSGAGAHRIVDQIAADGTRLAAARLALAAEIIREVAELIGRAAALGRATARSTRTGRRKLRARRTLGHAVRVAHRIDGIGACIATWDEARARRVAAAAIRRGRAAAAGARRAATAASASGRAWIRFGRTAASCSREQCRSSERHPGPGLHAHPPHTAWGVQCACRALSPDSPADHVAMCQPTRPRHTPPRPNCHRSRR